MQALVTNKHDQRQRQPDRTLRLDLRVTRNVIRNVNARCILIVGIMLGTQLFNGAFFIKILTFISNSIKHYLDGSHLMRA